METNEFKNLRHITLQFSAANDDQLKKYLAAKLTAFKNRNADLESQLSDTQRCLGESRAAGEESKQQLHKTQIAVAEATNALKTAHSEELTRLKEEHLEARRSLQGELDAKYGEKEMTMRRELERVREQYEEAQTKNQELTSAKYSLENEVSQLSNSLRRKTAALSEGQVELDKLRGDNRTLDATKFENEKMITQLRLRVAALEQQVIDKDQLIQNVSNQLEGTRGDKSNMEESIALLRKSLNASEDKNTQLTRDLEQVRRDLQQSAQQVESLQTKLEMKSSLIIHQEQLIEQRQKETIEAERKIQDGARDVSSKTAEVEQLRSALDTTKAHLEECQSQLKSNAKGE